MKISQRIRPSASMIVACVALFVALGGVGYAAVTIGSAQIQNNAVRSVDIKNRGVAKKDLSKKAVKALKGQKGAPGAKGDQGATGSDGTALAYAYVNSDGTVDETRSKGIADANVATGGGFSGIYGFRGLGFTPKNIQVTTAFDSAAVTGDNSSGGQGFIGDCDFVDGVDEACVSTNSDADPGSEPVQYFVMFN
jgi:hypothetical protein